MMEVEEQEGGTVVKRLSVPVGLEELMTGLTKEVLHKKPLDIYGFASDHFAQLLALRDNGNYQQAPSKSIIYASKDSMENLFANGKTQPSKPLSGAPAKQLSRQVSIRAASPTRKTGTKIKRSGTPKHDGNNNNEGKIKDKHDIKRPTFNRRQTPGSKSRFDSLEPVKEDALKVLTKRQSLSRRSTDRKSKTDSENSKDSKRSSSEESEKRKKTSRDASLQRKSVENKVQSGDSKELKGKKDRQEKPKGKKEEIKKKSSGEGSVEDKDTSDSKNSTKTKKAKKASPLGLQHSGETHDVLIPQEKAEDKSIEGKKIASSLGLQHSGEIHDPLIPQEKAQKASLIDEEKDKKDNIKEEHSDKFILKSPSIEESTTGIKDGRLTVTPPKILKEARTSSDNFDLPITLVVPVLAAATSCLNDQKSEDQPASTVEPADLKKEKAEDLRGDSETGEILSSSKVELEDKDASHKYDPSALREQLQKVEEEGKLNSFTSSYNPYKLRQEIKNVSMELEGGEQEEKNTQPPDSKEPGLKSSEVTEEKRTEEIHAKEISNEEAKEENMDKGLEQLKVSGQPENSKLHLLHEQTAVSEETTTGSIEATSLEHKDVLQEDSVEDDKLDKSSTPTDAPKAESPVVLSSTSGLQHSGELHDQMISQETSEDKNASDVKNVAEAEKLLITSKFSLQHSGELHDLLLPEESHKDNVIEDKKENEEAQKDQPLGLQHSGELHDTLIPKEASTEVAEIEEQQKTPSPGLQHSGKLHDTLIPKETSSEVAAIEEQQKTPSPGLQHSGELHDTLISKEATIAGAAEKPQVLTSDLQQPEKLQNDVISKSSLGSIEDEKEGDSSEEPRDGIAEKGKDLVENLKEELEAKVEEPKHKVDETIDKLKSQTVTDETIVQAATKIQAGVRGYLTRKEYKNRTPSGEAPMEEQTEPSATKTTDNNNKLSDEELHEVLTQLDNIPVPTESPHTNRHKREATPVDLMDIKMADITETKSEAKIEDELKSGDKDILDLKDEQDNITRDKLSRSKTVHVIESEKPHIPGISKSLSVTDSAISKTLDEDEDKMRDSVEDTESLEQTEDLGIESEKSATLHLETTIKNVEESKGEKLHEEALVVNLEHTGELHDTLVPKESETNHEKVESKNALVSEMEKEQSKVLQNDKTTEEVIILPKDLTSDIKEEPMPSKEPRQSVSNGLQHSGELHDLLTTKEVEETPVKGKISETQNLQHSGELHDILIPKEIVETSQELQKGEKLETENLQHSEELHDVLIPKEASKELQDDKNLIKDNLQHSGELHDLLIPKENEDIEAIQKKVEKDLEMDKGLAESLQKEKVDKQLETEGLRHSGELHDLVITKEEKDKKDLKAANLQHSEELHDALITKEAPKELQDSKNLIKNNLQHNGEVHDLSIPKEIEEIQKKIEKDVEKEEELAKSLQEEKHKELKTETLQHSGELHDLLIPKETKETHREEKDKKDLQTENLQPSGEIEDLLIPKSASKLDNDKSIITENLQHDEKLHELSIPAQAKETPQKEKGGEKLESENLQHSGSSHNLLIPKEASEEFQDAKNAVKDNLQHIEELPKGIKEVSQKIQEDTEKVMQNDKKLVKDALQHSGELHDLLIPKEIEKVAQEIQEDTEKTSQVLQEDKKLLKDTLQHSGELHDLLIPKEIQGVSQDIQKGAEKMSQILQDDEKLVKDTLQHSGELHDLLIPKEIKEVSQEVQKDAEKKSQVLQEDKKLLKDTLQHSGELHDLLIPKEVQHVSQDIQKGAEKMSQVLQDDKKLVKDTLQHSGELHDLLIPKEIQEVSQEVQKDAEKMSRVVQDDKKLAKDTLQHSGELHDLLIPKEIENVAQELQEGTEKTSQVLQDDKKLVKDTLQHSGELLDLPIPKEIQDVSQDIQEDAEKIFQVVQEDKKMVNDTLQHSGELHDVLIPKEIQETLQEVKDVKHLAAESIQHSNELAKKTSDELQKDKNLLKDTLQHSGELHDALILKKTEKASQKLKDDDKIREQQDIQTQSDVSPEKNLEIQPSEELHDLLVAKEAKDMSPEAQDNKNLKSTKKKDTHEEIKDDLVMGNLQHNGEIHDILVPKENETQDGIEGKTADTESTKPSSNDQGKDLNKKPADKKKDNVDDVSKPPSLGENQVDENGPTDPTKQESGLVLTSGLLHSGELHDVLIPQNVVLSEPQIEEEKVEVVEEIKPSSVGNVSAAPTKESPKLASTDGLQHSGEMHDILAPQEHFDKSDSKDESFKEGPKAQKEEIIRDNRPSPETLKIEETTTDGQPSPTQASSKEKDSNLQEPTGLQHTGELHDVLIPEQTNKDEDEGTKDSKPLSPNQVPNVEVAKVECSGNENSLNQPCTPSVLAEAPEIEEGKPAPSLNLQHDALLRNGETEQQADHKSHSKDAQNVEKDVARPTENVLALTTEFLHHELQMYAPKLENALHSGKIASIHEPAASEQIDFTNTVVDSLPKNKSDELLGRNSSKDEENHKARGGTSSASKESDKDGKTQDEEEDDKKVFDISKLHAELEEAGHQHEEESKDEILEKAKDSIAEKVVETKEENLSEVGKVALEDQAESGTKKDGQKSFDHSATTISNDIKEVEAQILTDSEVHSDSKSTSPQEGFEPSKLRAEEIGKQNIGKYKHETLIDTKGELGKETIKDVNKVQEGNVKLEEGQKMEELKSEEGRTESAAQESNKYNVEENLEVELKKGKKPEDKKEAVKGDGQNITSSEGEAREAPVGVTVDKIKVEKEGGQGASSEKLEEAKPEEEKTERALLEKTKDHVSAEKLDAALKEPEKHEDKKETVKGDDVKIASGDNEVKEGSNIASAVGVKVDKIIKDEEEKAQSASSESQNDGLPEENPSNTFDISKLQPQLPEVTKQENEDETSTENVVEIPNDKISQDVHKVTVVEEATKTPEIKMNEERAQSTLQEEQKTNIPEEKPLEDANHSNKSFDITKLRAELEEAGKGPEEDKTVPVGDDPNALVEDLNKVQGIGDTKLLQVKEEKVEGVKAAKVEKGKGQIALQEIPHEKVKEEKSPEDVPDSNKSFDVSKLRAELEETGKEMNKSLINDSNALGDLNKVQEVSEEKPTQVKKEAEMSVEKGSDQTNLHEIQEENSPGDVSGSKKTFDTSKLRAELEEAGKEKEENKTESVVGDSNVFDKQEKKDEIQQTNKEGEEGSKSKHITEEKRNIKETKAKEEKTQSNDQEDIIPEEKLSKEKTEPNKSCDLSKLQNELEDEKSELGKEDAEVVKVSDIPNQTNKTQVQENVAEKHIQSLNSEHLQDKKEVEESKIQKEEVESVLGEAQKANISEVDSSTDQKPFDISKLHSELEEANRQPEEKSEEKTESKVSESTTKDIFEESGKTKDEGNEVEKNEKGEKIKIISKDDKKVEDINIEKETNQTSEAKSLEDTKTFDISKLRSELAGDEMPKDHNKAAQSVLEDQDKIPEKNSPENRVQSKTFDISKLRSELEDAGTQAQDDKNEMSTNKTEKAIKEGDEKETSLKKDLGESAKPDKIHPEPKTVIDEDKNKAQSKEDNEKDAKIITLEEKIHFPDKQVNNSSSPISDLNSSNLALNVVSAPVQCADRNSENSLTDESPVSVYESAPTRPATSDITPNIIPNKNIQIPSDNLHKQVQDLHNSEQIIKPNIESDENHTLEVEDFNKNANVEKTFSQKNVSKSEGAVKGKHADKKAPEKEISLNKELSESSLNDKEVKTIDAQQIVTADKDDNKIKAEEERERPVSITSTTSTDSVTTVVAVSPREKDDDIKFSFERSLSNSSEKSEESKNDTQIEDKIPTVHIKHEGGNNESKEVLGSRKIEKEDEKEQKEEEKEEKEEGRGENEGKKEGKEGKKKEKEETTVKPFDMSKLRAEIEEATKVEEKEKIEAPQKLQPENVSTEEHHGDANLSKDIEDVAAEKESFAKTATDPSKLLKENKNLKETKKEEEKEKLKPDLQKIEDNQLKENEESLKSQKQQVSQIKDLENDGRETKAQDVDDTLTQGTPDLKEEGFKVSTSEIEGLKIQQNQEIPKDEILNNRHTAATKIQSNYWGYRVRRDLSRQGSSTPQEKGAFDVDQQEKHPRSNSADIDEHVKITLLQHTENEDKHDVLPKVPPEVVSPTSQELEDTDKSSKEVVHLNNKDTAATKIQSNYRGYRVRRDLSRQGSTTPQEKGAFHIGQEENQPKNNSAGVDEHVKNTLLQPTDKEDEHEIQQKVVTLDMVSPTTQKLEDIDKSSKEVVHLDKKDTAATTIQSNYRGYRVRRDLSRQGSSTSQEKGAFDIGQQEKQPRSNSADIDEHVKITLLQHTENEDENEVLPKVPPEIFSPTSQELEDTDKSSKEVVHLNNKDTAATKIQSNYRGYRVRRDLSRQGSSTPQEKGAFDVDQQEKHSRSNSTDINEHVKITLLQHTENEDEHDVLPKVPPEIVSPTSQELEDTDKSSKEVVHLNNKDTAATKIQSNYRGYRVRRDLSRQGSTTSPQQKGAIDIGQEDRKSRNNSADIDERVKDTLLQHTDNEDEHEILPKVTSTLDMVSPTSQELKDTDKSSKEVIPSAPLDSRDESDQQAQKTKEALSASLVSENSAILADTDLSSNLQKDEIDSKPMENCLANQETKSPSAIDKPTKASSPPVSADLKKPEEVEEKNEEKVNTGVVSSASKKPESSVALNVSNESSGELPKSEITKEKRTKETSSRVQSAKDHDSMNSNEGSVDFGKSNVNEVKGSSETLSREQSAKGRDSTNSTEKEKSSTVSEKPTTVGDDLLGVKDKKNDEIKEPKSKTEKQISEIEKEKDVEITPHIIATAPPLHLLDHEDDEYLADLTGNTSDQYNDKNDPRKNATTPLALLQNDDLKTEAKLKDQQSASPSEKEQSSKKEIPPLIEPIKNAALIGQGLMAIKNVDEKIQQSSFPEGHQSPRDFPKPHKLNEKSEETEVNIPSDELQPRKFETKHVNHNVSPNFHNDEEGAVPKALGVVLDQQLAITAPNAEDKEQRTETEGPEYIYIPLKSPAETPTSTKSSISTEASASGLQHSGELHDTISIPLLNLNQKDETPTDLNLKAKTNKEKESKIEDKTISKEFLSSKYDLVEGGVSPRTHKEGGTVPKALGVVLDQHLAITAPHAEEKQENVESEAPEYIHIPLKATDEPSPSAGLQHSGEFHDTIPIPLLTETKNEENLVASKTPIFKPQKTTMSAQEQKTETADKNLVDQSAEDWGHKYDLMESPSPRIGKELEGTVPRALSVSVSDSGVSPRIRKTVEGTVPKALGVVLDRQLAIIASAGQMKEEDDPEYIYIPLKDPNKPSKDDEQMNGLQVNDSNKPPLSAENEVINDVKGKNTDKPLPLQEKEMVHGLQEKESKDSSTSQQKELPHGLPDDDRSKVSTSRKREDLSKSSGEGSKDQLPNNLHLTNGENEDANKLFTSEEKILMIDPHSILTSKDKLSKSSTSEKQVTNGVQSTNDLLDKDFDENSPSEEKKLPGGLQGNEESIKPITTPILENQTQKLEEQQNGASVSNLPFDGKPKNSSSELGVKGESSNLSPISPDQHNLIVSIPTFEGAAVLDNKAKVAEQPIIEEPLMEKASSSKLSSADLKHTDPKMFEPKVLELARSSETLPNKVASSPTSSPILDHHSQHQANDGTDLKLAISTTPISIKDAERPIIEEPLMEKASSSKLSSANLKHSDPNIFEPKVSELARSPETLPNKVASSPTSSPILDHHSQHQANDGRDLKLAISTTPISINHETASSLNLPSQDLQSAGSDLKHNAPTNFEPKVLELASSRGTSPNKIPTLSPSSPILNHHTQHQAGDGTALKLAISTTPTLINQETSSSSLNQADLQHAGTPTVGLHLRFSPSPTQNFEGRPETISPHSELANLSPTSASSDDKENQMTSTREDRSIQSESPPIVIQTSQISDNTMPLAVQLNQAPGAAVVTSPTPNYDDDAGESVSARNEAHAPEKGASTKVEAPQNSAHFRTSMETGKRKNATIIEKNMEEVAATKIQAGFRGYQVRKQLKSKNGGVDSISQRRSLRRKSSGKLRGSEKMSQKASSKQPSDLEEKSATKIQAGIRGFLVRRRQQKKVKNNATPESS